ncbi:MAG: HAD-IIIA family hydrolase, partial [Selenomonadaceae bacterium]|nr:HAD-IIIA family hydrolase [Selenomonadaceae bacterium]
MTTEGKKAVFFDRDGTLNVDTDYLYKIEEFRWEEDAVEAIRYCNDKGWLVIVVTNQSGVARGYYTEADVERLHAWMNEDLQKHGAHIDAFYYCPHHPKG